MDGLTQPGIFIICGSICCAAEPVRLPEVFLRCNKTALIVSNDKADTPVPDAIIKSGLINQTAA